MQGGSHHGADATPHLDERDSGSYPLKECRKSILTLTELPRGQQPLEGYAACNGKLLRHWFATWFVFSLSG